MSPRVSPRREPLAVALVLLNLSLAAVLIHRRMNRPAPGALPPGHPDVSVPMRGMGAVSGSGSMETSPALAAGYLISGSVKLSDRLKDRWPKGAYVFAIARAEGAGPPYAVRRYSGLTPPFTFALGSENLMIAGLPAPKRLIVAVRVDQDGDAMTHQRGDLESGPSASVPPGSWVEIVVDRPVELAPAR